MKVISTVSKERMERYRSDIPSNIEIEYLKKDFTEKEFLEAAKDVNYILLSIDGLTGDIIRKLDGVKLIQSVSVGYDKIDIEAAKEKDIYVCNAKGANKEAVAEFTIGLIIGLKRRILESHISVMNKDFKRSYNQYAKLKIKGLDSSHVGIIGLGDIGEEVIKRLKPFGAKISYYNRTRKKELEKIYEINYMELDEIYENCDIISLHIPLTDKTRNMINKNSIRKMKDDVIIINTSRGGIINEKDLVEAIELGNIGGAGIDTFEKEPLDSDSVFYNLSEQGRSNVILTSHIGGITYDVFRDMQLIAWENISRIEKGLKPLNIVNDL